MSSKKKDEHLAVALAQPVRPNDFDKVPIYHKNLSGLSLSDINLGSTFLGYDVDLPIYINATTGGSKKSAQINEFFAKIANHFNIPMIVGSQSISLKDRSLVETFSIVRKFNPKGTVVANLSANATLDEAKVAIDDIKANGLSIHLNLVQELIMQDGDRDFSSWSKNIKNLAVYLSVPLLVKEVGFGMDNDEVKKLFDLGVKYVDISGKGGSCFATIEHKRNNENIIFADIGYSTVEVLTNLNKIKEKPQIYASGGIRSEVDVFKALQMGAKMVGLSDYFLRLSLLSYDEAIKKVEAFILNLKKLFLLTGNKSIKELHS